MSHNNVSVGGEFESVATIFIFAEGANLIVGERNGVNSAVVPNVGQLVATCAV